IVTNPLRFLAGLSAAAIIGAPAALAQDEGPQARQIDEPYLDPISGKKREMRDDRPRHTNDDEIDQENKRHPLLDFVGVLTFLAPSNTDLSIGVGPEYRPDYFGSDDFEWVPDPEVYVTFRNFVFLDNDGADLALIGFSGFSFGPSLRLTNDR